MRTNKLLYIIFKHSTKCRAFNYRYSTECGNGFPEVSLLLPLCNELDITVNELLSAKRLSDDSYKQKAEENIMNLIKEKEENQKKWKSMIVTGVISTVSFITLIMIVALYAEAISMTAKIIIVAIACAIFVIGLYSAMQNERTIGYYKCPHCGTKKYCKKVMSKDE